jgi:predicted  nucleic acid-binding Zn-ribbon protein
MFKYATMRTAAELRERQRRALGRLADLEAEHSTLQGRVSEAAAVAARRRIEAAKGETGEEFDVATDSEMSALLRREDELPHEIHALRVAAAELEIETLEAGMRERRAAFEKLAPGVETARIGYEDSKAYYEEVKRERDNLAPSSMQDYDLRRASDALQQIQAEAPRG